jgi:hypothetical protein
MAISDDANFQKNHDFPINFLPGYFNMLNNFGFIKYKKTVIPRLIFDPNISNNWEQLIYLPMENQPINEIKKSEIDNICIVLDKDENNSNTIDTKEKKKINEKREIFDQNFSINQQYNNNYFKEKKPNILSFNEKITNPIPPKSFSSIINNNLSVQNNLMINNDFNNNLQNINDIILNNIHLLSNDIFIPNKINIFFKYLINKTDNAINQNIIGSNSSQFPPLQQEQKCQQLSSDKKKVETEGNVKVSKRRKRNEKNENIMRRVHTAADYDNILRKIQVHFLSFIINFTNDVINTLIDDKNVPKFKNLDYKIKKTVNHKFVEELKSKDIGEILQLKVSPKMKKFDGSVNKVIYDTIYGKYPIIHSYMNKSYLSLFKEYYNSVDKIFVVNGQVIHLSTKTKIFCDLVKKNAKYKDKMKYVAINYFLNCYKRIKKPNFKTHIVKK